MDVLRSDGMLGDHWLLQPGAARAITGAMAGKDSQALVTLPWPYMARLYSRRTYLHAQLICGESWS